MTDLVPTPERLAELQALLPFHGQATRVVTYGAYFNGGGDRGAQIARDMVAAFPELLAAAAHLRNNWHAPDANWDTAVDWLINSGAASDMGTQDAFWMLSQGMCTEEEADNGHTADGRTISEARTAYQMRGLQ